MDKKNSDKNKINKKTTWFGFTLTHQLAVILFTLALIGIVLIPISLIGGIFGLISYMSHFNLYDGTYFLQSLAMNISIIISMCVLLVICFYTIIRTRNIRNPNS